MVLFSFHCYLKLIYSTHSSHISIHIHIFYIPLPAFVLISRECYRRASLSVFHTWHLPSRNKQWNKQANVHMYKCIYTHRYPVWADMLSFTTYALLRTSRSKNYSWFTCVNIIFCVMMASMAMTSLKVGLHMWISKPLMAFRRFGLPVWISIFVWWIMMANCICFGNVILMTSLKVALPVWISFSVWWRLRWPLATGPGSR